MAAIESTQSMAQAAARVAAKVAQQTKEAEQPSSASSSGGMATPPLWQRERSSLNRRPADLQLRKSVTFSGVVTLDEEDEDQDRLEDHQRKGRSLVSTLSSASHSEQPADSRGENGAVAATGAAAARLGRAMAAAQPYQAPTATRRPISSPFSSSPFAAAESQDTAASEATPRGVANAGADQSASSSGTIANGQHQQGRGTGRAPKQPGFVMPSPFAEEPPPPAIAEQPPWAQKPAQSSTPVISSPCAAEESRAAPAKARPPSISSPFAEQPEAEEPQARAVKAKHVPISSVFGAPEEKPAVQSDGKPSKAGFAGIRSPLAES